MKSDSTDQPRSPLFSSGFLLKYSRVFVKFSPLLLSTMEYIWDSREDKKERLKMLVRQMIMFLEEVSDDLERK